ncbi:hypothetical protein GGS26DRAFT_600734, partial [Hypomontagnella submonticulosa]
CSSSATIACHLFFPFIPLLVVRVKFAEHQSVPWAGLVPYIFLFLHTTSQPQHLWFSPFIQLAPTKHHHPSTKRFIMSRQDVAAPEPPELTDLRAELARYAFALQVIPLMFSVSRPARWYLNVLASLHVAICGITTYLPSVHLSGFSPAQTHSLQLELSALLDASYQAFDALGQTFTRFLHTVEENTRYKNTEMRTVE